MRISEEKQIEYDNLVFCLTIAFESVSELFCGVIGLIFGDVGGLGSFVIYGLYFLLFFRLLPRLLKAINGKDLVFFSFLAVVFLTSSLRNEYDFAITAELLPKLLWKGIPFYFSAKLVHDSPKLNRYLRFFGCVILLNVVRRMVLYRTIGFGNLDYFQYEGYMLLNAMVLLFAPLVMEHRLLDFATAGIVLVMEFLTGARGPLLIAGMLLAAALLFLCRGRKYSKLLYMGLLICAIMISLSSQIVLPAMAKLLGNSGNLRSIERLLNGSFFKDPTRTRIATASWEYISKHLFIGSGVGNDRIFIQREVYGPARNINGCYSHNIFLEIGMQFGFILGLILCGILAFLIVRRYNRCALYQEKLLLISLFFAGFVPLMISESYLRWGMFYALMGFAARSDTFGGISLNEQNS